jgi:hypothetical protein
MSTLARAAVLLASAVLCAAAAPAQRASRYTSPEHGFRLLVPRYLELVPLEPNERQALVKWVAKGDDPRNINQVSEILLVVRIARKAAVTGPVDPEQERERLLEKTTRDAAIEQLNGGDTVPEFLERRGYKSDLKPVEGKPVKSRNGDVFTVLGLPYSAAAKDPSFSILSCTIDGATEIFGLVSLQFRGGVAPDHLEPIARSLERGDFKGRDQDDIYEGSDLKGIDFRREVRKKLVKGWEAYDTENFIFITTCRNQKVIDDMCVDLEIMRLVYAARFPPVAPITAISAVRYCEKYDDYLAYGGAPGTGGYWNFVEEELVLADVRTMGSDILKHNPNLKNISPEDVLYHEAMHQYFFYANGHLAPGSWFNEGYGEYFGGTTVDRRKAEPRKINRNKFRMDWIMRARRQGAWPDLGTFLKMSQAEFYGHSFLQNYAFAWAFCFFLEEQRQDARNGNAEWAALPDLYLKNLREITEATRKKHGFDERDKKWLMAFETEIQKQAYAATFQGVDLLALEKAWIEAMKKWR